MTRPETDLVDVVAVDDDPTVCSFLRSLFEMQPWRVRVFERPGDALAFLATHPARVLLTDINMPEMNGVELARMGRRRRPDMALVAFTGSIHDLSTLGGDFTAVVRKPAGVETILDAVGRLLGEAVPGSPPDETQTRD